MFDHFLGSAGPGLMSRFVKGHISVAILRCFLQHSSSPREWPLENDNLFAWVSNIADSTFVSHLVWCSIEQQASCPWLNTHCKLGWIIPARFQGYETGRSSLAIIEHKKHIFFNKVPVLGKSSFYTVYLAYTATMILDQVGTCASFLDFRNSFVGITSHQLCGISTECRSGTAVPWAAKSAFLRLASCQRMLVGAVACSIFQLSSQIQRYTRFFWRSQPRNQKTGPLLKCS